MSDQNPFELCPLTTPPLVSDPDYLALLSLQQHLTAKAPSGLRARLRRFFERRQLKAVLDRIQSGQSRADAIIEYRSQIKYLAPLLFVMTVVPGMLSPRGLGRGGHWALQLVISAVGAAALAWLLYRWAPKAEDAHEELCAKWLERARALRPSDGPKPSEPGEGAA